MRNIPLFDSTLNNKVKNFVEKVQLNNDVLKFADGLDTVVDLDNDNLSGGQKQKIVLARTQIHKSQFVLMDEATSALDNQSQQIVQDTISKMKNDKTIIIVAHRLTTIKDCDRIFVIDNNQIIG